MMDAFEEPHTVINEHNLQEAVTVPFPFNWPESKRELKAKPVPRRDEIMIVTSNADIISAIRMLM